jgi:hemerythrin-like domain-containing protein
MTQNPQSVTAILREEHEAISMVLDYLDRATGALARGRPVNPGIFRDMLRFVELFVGRCHHGKEEQIVFPLLRHQSVTTDAIITQLEAEHEQGERLAESFAQAVAGYTVDDPGTASPLVAAANAYGAHLRRHIRFEDERLLAPAEQMGSSPALAATVARFERFEDEVMGAGTHEQLHRMIDTLGPRVAVYSS